MSAQNTDQQSVLDLKVLLPAFALSPSNPDLLLLRQQNLQREPRVGKDGNEVHEVLKDVQQFLTPGTRAAGNGRPPLAIAADKHLVCGQWLDDDHVVSF